MPDYKGVPIANFGLSVLILGKLVQSPIPFTDQSSNKEVESDWKGGRVPRHISVANLQTYGRDK